MNNKSKEKTRVFIGFFLPEEVKDKIVEIQKKLPFFKGKKTERKNLHLTLKFLGELSDKEIELVKEKLEEIKFKKKICFIDSIGFFSKDFIKIIWIHLSNCEDLQKKIDESLKNFFEPEKRFMSHLTIARVKSVQNKSIFINKLNEICFEKISFEIEEFYLIKSDLKKEGPRYSILKEFHLI